MNLSQKPLMQYRKNKLFYSRININAKPWKGSKMFVFLELFLGMANCSRLTPAPKQLLFQIKGRLYKKLTSQLVFCFCLARYENTFTTLHKIVCVLKLYLATTDTNCEVLFREWILFPRNWLLFVFMWQKIFYNYN